MTITQEIRDRIVREYRAGVPDREIAKTYGVPVVYPAMLDRRALLRRPKRVAPPPSREQIVFLKDIHHFLRSSDGCQFPSGDPKAADFKFCGAKRHADRPYCTAHCRVAYQNFQCEAA